MAKKKKYSKTYESMEEKELKEQIYTQFELSKRYLDSIHERMNQQEELYRTFIDKNNYPHNARVFDPRVFRVIETVTPRMVANEPTGNFYPSEEGDVITAQIFNALIKYDWRKAEMFPKLVNFVKSMLIFGTAFGRTYWDFQERERTRMVPKEIGGRMVWSPANAEKIMVTEFDSPNFEVLNIYDCFPDPNATNMHNMRWFIYRTFKTIDELRRENETRDTDYYKNLDELEQKIMDKKTGKGDGDMNYEGSQWREHRRTMLSTEELVGEDESNPELLILRRFTRDGWCDYAVEHDVIIREVENPYFHGDLPIIHGVDYPYPGELYGMGEIEPVDRIQRAINAVLNQRLDNVQLTLRNMWKVKKNADVDLHTLVSAPGNVIMTGDMNAVEPVQVPDVTGSTFVQTMNYLTSALQNGTGITDYTIGIGGNNNVGNKTATGTRLIQQEANAQFKLKIQLFNHMVIERIANHWKDLRIQYTTEEQRLRIIGKETIDYLTEETDLAKTGINGEQIVPGDMETPAKLSISKDQNFAFLELYPEDIQPSIVGDYDFIATVSSDQLMDPIVMQENFFTALDRVMQQPWIQGLAQEGKTLNFSALTEKVFDKLHLGIEAKDAISELRPPEMQSPQAQAMQPGQITEAMGGPQESPFPSIDELVGGNNGQEPIA